METRIVLLEQIEQLKCVAEEVFDGPVRAEYAQAFIDCPRHVMFLACRDGLVIGMISGVEYFHPDKPAELWINELGVGSAYRRRGVGQDLLRALLEHGRERGCRGAFVVTEQDNDPARKLYQSLDPESAEQAAVFYEWRLEKPRQ